MTWQRDVFSIFRYNACSSTLLLYFLLPVQMHPASLKVSKHKYENGAERILFITEWDNSRVENFRPKNHSAEDGIDQTNGYFRWNSGCSAEQKIFGIPFRTLPRKRKQLGIPFRRPYISANSRNSLAYPSSEEKTPWNSVAWNRNRSKLSEFRSEPFRGRENNSEQNAAAAVSDSIHIESSWELLSTTLVLSHFVQYLDCSVKLNFFAKFRSVPFRASELALPRNSECLGLSTFFRWITETIPSLFRRIFSERNSVPNPIIIVPNIA